MAIQDKERYRREKEDFCKRTDVDDDSDDALVNEGDYKGGDADQGPDDVEDKNNGDIRGVKDEDNQKRKTIE